MKTGAFEVSQEVAQACSQEEIEGLKNSVQEIKMAQQNALGTELMVRTAMTQASGTQAARLLDANDSKQMGVPEICRLSKNVESGASICVDSAVAKGSNSQAVVVSSSVQPTIAGLFAQNSNLSLTAELPILPHYNTSTAKNPVSFTENNKGSPMLFFNSPVTFGNNNLAQFNSAVPLSHDHFNLHNSPEKKDLYELGRECGSLLYSACSAGYSRFEEKSIKDAYGRLISKKSKFRDFFYKKADVNLSYLKSSFYKDLESSLEGKYSSENLAFFNLGIFLKYGKLVLSSVNSDSDEDFMFSRSEYISICLVGEFSCLIEKMARATNPKLTPSSLQIAVQEIVDISRSLMEQNKKAIENALSGKGRFSDRSFQEKVEAVEKEIFDYFEINNNQINNHTSSNTQQLSNNSIKTDTQAVVNNYYFHAGQSAIKNPNVIGHAERVKIDTVIMQPTFTNDARNALPLLSPLPDSKNYNLSLTQPFQGKNTMPRTESFHLISSWTENTHASYVQQLSQAAGNHFKDHLVFPDDAALAYLADAVYKDDGGTLEAGWVCIAIEHNKESGYFGAAYWHDAKRQLVIAHRGTETQAWDTFRRDFYVDINSIMHGEVSSYIGEAYAFTRQVITAAQAKGRIYSLSFTGHSLGAWLAQVMTLCMAIEGLFAHTVVFDSPGARPMLERSQHRASLEKVNIDELDITTYLSLPNLVNTCHAHVGTLYQLYPALPEWKGLLGKPKELLEYTRKSHDMAMLLSLFRSATYRKPERVSRVIDWPVIEWKQEKQTEARVWWWARQLQGWWTQDTTEYQTFFEFAHQANQYNPQGSHLNDGDKFLLRYKAHYQVRAIENDRFLLKLDKNSQQLLNDICQINTYIHLDTRLDCVQGVNDILKKHFNQQADAINALLQGVKQENDTITSPLPAETLRNAIYTFQLFFPDIVQAIQKVKSEVVREIVSKQAQTPTPLPVSAVPALIGTITGAMRVENLIRAPQVKFPAGQLSHEAVKGALDLTRGWREIQQQYPNQNARLADNVNEFHARNIVQEPLVEMTALPLPEQGPSSSSGSSTPSYTPAYGLSQESSRTSNPLALPEGITLSADGKRISVDVGHFQDEKATTLVQNLLQGKKRGIGSDYYIAHTTTPGGKVDEITFNSPKGADNLIKELNQMMAAFVPSVSQEASLGKQ